MPQSFHVQNRPIKPRLSANRRQPRVRISSLIIFGALGVGVIGFAAFLVLIFAIAMTTPGGAR